MSTELINLMNWELWSRKDNETDAEYHQRIVMLDHEYRQLIRGRGVPIVCYTPEGNIVIEYRQEIDIESVRSNAKKWLRRIALHNGESVQIEDWKCPYCATQPYMMRAIIPHGRNSVILYEGAFFNSRNKALKMPDQVVGVAVPCVCLPGRIDELKKAMPKKSRTSRQSNYESEE